MEANDQQTDQGTEMNRASRLAVCIPLLLLLTACATPGIKPVTNANNLGSDDIMIVGKIRLEPKFDPSEQDIPLMMFNRDMVKGKAFMAFDNELKPMDDYATFSGVSKLASVAFNKTFMLGAKRTDPLIFAGAFFMISGNQANDFYYLPGGLKFKYNKKDKAIYVGTLVFHRNEFDEITKVKIIDEYKEANKLFKKNNGKKSVLRKIKPTLLKKKNK